MILLLLIGLLAGLAILSAGFYKGFAKNKTLVVFGVALSLLSLGLFVFSLFVFADGM